MSNHFTCICHRGECVLGRPGRVMSNHLNCICHRGECFLGDLRGRIYLNLSEALIWFAQHHYRYHHHDTIIIITIIMCMNAIPSSDYSYTNTTLIHTLVDTILTAIYLDCSRTTCLGSSVPSAIIHVNVQQPPQN
jgi:hypothetical protein